jgi:hypothetical protein
MEVMVRASESEAGVPPTAGTQAPRWRIRSYVLFILVIAALTFGAPVPQPKVLLSSERAFFGRSSLAISGSSLVNATSNCDRDSRNLAVMLGHNYGAPALDLSYGMQTLNESVNFAAMAIRNPHVQQIVVALPLTSFGGWDENDLHEYLFFRAVNPALPAETLVERMRAGAFQGGHIDPVLREFQYRGTRYPDYNGLKALYFARAKAAMGCPESDGGNVAFLEAYYDHQYVGLKLREENFGLIASLSQSARRSGKEVYVVMMPLDYELMKRLNPSIVDGARSQVAYVTGRLRLLDVDVVDISDTLSNSDFADRWCGCGHLQETGRSKVAAMIADALKAGPGGSMVAANRPPSL